jgi:hypothetical protein
MADSRLSGQVAFAQLLPTAQTTFPHAPTIHLSVEWPTRPLTISSALKERLARFTAWWTEIENTLRLNIPYVAQVSEPEASWLADRRRARLYAI